MITLIRSLLIWIIGLLVVWLFKIDFDFTFLMALAISAIITCLKIIF